MNVESEANEKNVAVDRVVNCEHCDDGDGGCAYPIYGLAPHSHDKVEKGGSFIGSTVFTDRSEWPDNFVEDSDPDYKGCGTYTHCPCCGAGS
jgi:hypothetical protein